MRDTADALAKVLGNLRALDGTEADNDKAKGSVQM